MPINTRSNGSKRGIAPKRASNSSSQPSTRRQTAAAQSLLSVSNSNSRIVRRNDKSQKQIDRGGGLRTKNKTKSPNIDAIAAAALGEPRPEDTGSDGEIDKNANEAQGEDEEVDEPDFDNTLMDDFPLSLPDLSGPRNPAYIWNYEGGGTGVEGGGTRAESGGTRSSNEYHVSRVPRSVPYPSL